MPWEQDLTNEQINAASHIGRHARLLAGPGTGKTLCLTRRILYLIEEEDANAIEYQIEVSPDVEASTVKWYILLSWTDLAQDGEVALAITDAWDGLRIGVRSNVEAADGVVSAWIDRKRR